MAKLQIKADLARALSTVGGRSLFKSMELLAGNIASAAGGKMVSDGTAIKLSLPSGSVRIRVEDSGVHRQGKYYTFQDGVVVFSGKQPVLANLVQILLSFAAKRQPYLADKDLSRYGLSKEFVASMCESVQSLKIKS